MLQTVIERVTREFGYPDSEIGRKVATPISMTNYTVQIGKFALFTYGSALCLSEKLAVY